MKTWKKVILGLILLGLLSFAAYIVKVLLNPGTIIPGSSVTYHTKEELIDLYWQNKVVLNSVKNSVLSNKGMMQELIDFKEGDIGILTEHEKEFFTEEEWANIVSVFKNLHPYMLMMERQGRPVKFYINFLKLELETGYKRTSLYWFTDKKEIEYDKEHTLADSVEYTQIDGNWFIVEKMYDR